MAKIIDTLGKYLIVALITLAMFIFFLSVERKPLLADDNTSFVRAVVTQNDNEDLQAEASLDSGDSQKVVLLIKSGSHKGETVDAYSLNGYLYGANCKVGVLGDKRTIHSLDAIDNIHDPHQRQGVAMLEGLATFQPIVPFIRDHHFSPNHRGSREQHIVYFADAFERLLPADSHVAAWPTRAVVEQFVALHREIDPPLCDILCEVAENANFWQHLHPGHIQRLLEIIGPINTRYLDIHGLKDVCLLIAKIVDTYSSFTATHSIMVGEIARQLARWMQLPEPTCQQIQIAGYLHDIGTSGALKPINAPS